MGETPTNAALEGQKWSEEKGLIKLFDHPGEALARVSDILRSSGKAIGAIMEKFGSEPVPASDVFVEMQGLADQTGNASAAATLERVAKRVEKLSENGTLNWKSLNEIKGMLGPEVHEHPNIARAYGEIAKRINGMVDMTAEKIGDPSIRMAYDSAKKDYRMGSLLEPALSYGESKNLIGGPAGHNTLRGVLGQLVEALTGLPPARQMVRNAQAVAAPAIKKIGAAPTSVANAWYRAESKRTHQPSRQPCWENWRDILGINTKRANRYAILPSQSRQKRCCGHKKRLW
jgi:hypothetical protein